MNSLKKIACLSLFILLSQLDTYCQKKEVVQKICSRSEPKSVIIEKVEAYHKLFHDPDKYMVARLYDFKIYKEDIYAFFEISDQHISSLNEYRVERNASGSVKRRYRQDISKGSKAYCHFLKNGLENDIRYLKGVRNVSWRLLRGEIKLLNVQDIKSSSFKSTLEVYAKQVFIEKELENIEPKYTNLYGQVIDYKGEPVSNASLRITSTKSYYFFGKNCFLPEINHQTNKDGTFFTTKLENKLYEKLEVTSGKLPSKTFEVHNLATNSSNYFPIGKTSRSKEKKIYKKAIQANNIETYRKYFVCHPNGKFKTKIMASAEPKFFQEAEEKYAIFSYEEYLKYFPQGKHKAQAINKIEEINNFFKYTKLRTHSSDYNKKEELAIIKHFKDFIHHYPHSKLIKDHNGVEGALTKIRKAETKIIQNSNSISLLNYFLKDLYTEDLQNLARVKLIELRRLDRLRKQEELEKRRKQNLNHWANRIAQELAEEVMTEISPNTGRQPIGKVASLRETEDEIIIKVNLQWRAALSQLHESAFWANNGGLKRFEVIGDYHLNKSTLSEHFQVLYKNDYARRAIRDENVPALLGIAALIAGGTKKILESPPSSGVGSGHYEEYQSEKNIPCYIVLNEKGYIFGSSKRYYIRCTKGWQKGREKLISYNGSTGKYERGLNTSQDFDKIAKDTCDCK